MTGTVSEPAALAIRMEEIAREAGGVLRDRFRGPRVIEKKGSTDLVTDADRAAESLILDRLARLFPGVPVLAEEAGEIHGNAIDLRFIVDPLDGTTNYAHGLPHFATTIAAEDSHGLVAGITYNPLRDEMYAAHRGGGAWCNGAPLRVSTTAGLQDAVLATGFPYDVASRANEILGFFSDFLPRARAIRRFGSAALNLAWVAHGRYDGYWERGLMPWDMAAGVLLVAEAGGTVSDYRGDPALPVAGECIASAPGLHAAMVEVTRRRLAVPASSAS